MIYYNPKPKPKPPPSTYYIYCGKLDAEPHNGIQLISVSKKVG
jgi:hypothetical protein